MSEEKIEFGERRKNKVRLAPDSFSDIIFGLALSIGSLILIQNQVAAWQNFVWNIALFGFSFAIIAMVWLSFSTSIRYLSTEVSSVVFLNLLLFFCVVLEPYLFYMLVKSSGQLLEAVSDVFALDIGLMFFVLGTLASIVIREARLNHPDYHSEDLKSLQRMIYPRYILGALCLLSIAPFFWTYTPLGQLRFVIWMAALAVYFIFHIATTHLGLFDAKAKSKPQQTPTKVTRS